MNNKEILPANGLPLYEVEEMSLLDAMILLKRNGGVLQPSTIERAAERLNPAFELPAASDAGSLS
ncbi:MAG: hypothetical protein N0E37_14840 [Candidatus Thiodiazotropha taylori]|nr:hypothetical protein [Candidatus Thiodiazotropha taylori]MCG7962456.1 hypothetical protein [Candidatus Thiodiazotropha endolucinida]RLW56429.1 MAG: hypothetical protein B6D76_00320 [gamma proteobacterium symbiont of Stewartia floridana]MCG7919023.1 hypothetical protein [Candidatus Thiodiazotropha taylori]MCG7960723.1 hypothetical protein [Candidatus Thiodiazotropha taylori]